SLSDLEIVGCKSAAAVHFPPSFCPIAGLWGCKSGKNCPRWGRFSLLTLQVRQPPSPENGACLEEFCIAVRDFLHMKYDFAAVPQIFSI
ncbi:MAG TPA: hypothetical protein PK238_06965, partial [Giesbergeria sp.]|nr:hypothetical protein [Giesbergeria sp.]